MKKLPEITMNDWIEAEKSLLPDAPPPNSKTRRTYAHEKGLSLSAAGARLKKMVDLGCLKIIVGIEPTGGIVNYYVPTHKNGKTPK